MSLPTAKEINPYNSLDGKSAEKKFLGKDLTEAEAMFACGQESDLMWMGPVAFRYYVQAAIRFLQSDKATGQADFVTSFVGTLEHRLTYEPIELVQIAEQLADICGYVVAEYGRLGDLPKTEEEAAARIEALQESFAKFEDVLGKDHRAEDYIDLRPRFEALRREFLSLSKSPLPKK